MSYNKEYEKAIKYGKYDTDTDKDMFQAKIQNYHDGLPHLVHADHLDETYRPLAASHIREAAENPEELINHDSHSDLHKNDHHFLHTELSSYYTPTNNSVNLVHSGVDRDNKTTFHKISYVKKFPSLTDAIQYNEELKKELGRKYENNV